MKHILILILIISTLQLAGQNHLIGVKSSVNWTNITSDNFISEINGMINYSPNKTRRGLTAGLTYEFLTKKYFSIGADLIYNQRGFTNDDIFTVLLGTGEKHTTAFNYDYVSLPIKTGFNIGSTLYGFVSVGVIPSLLIDARTIWPTFDSNGNITGNATFDETNRVSKFDFAGLVEAGGGYKFKERYWLFTSFTYQHSFNTITNSDYYPRSIARHNGMSLTTGIKYSLTRKQLSTILEI